VPSVRRCDGRGQPDPATFGYRVLTAAHARRYERGGVTAALVDAYRTPQLVRGWERGLLRFIAARVAGGGGLAASLRSRGADDERGGQAAELARVVAEHGIKARARPPAPGSAARLSWGEGGGESVCDRMMCLHAPA